MKRFTAPFVALALVLGAATGAVAYMLASGSGTGNGTTGSISAPVISAVTATPTTALLPGASADTTFKISNSNSVALTIVSVAGNGSISVVGGNGCTALNAAVTFSNQTGLNISIPAGASNYTVHLPSSVSMGASSDSGCQGATFDIPVLVTVHHP